jgi:hypothetical protein
MYCYLVDRHALGDQQRGTDLRSHVVQQIGTLSETSQQALSAHLLEYVAVFAWYAVPVERGSI